MANEARAVRIHEHGGPEVLRLETVPLPEPGRGEVVVRLEAAALNHLDLWVRRGIPGVRFALPLTLGCDGAGIVEDVGRGVADLAPGTPVFVFPGVSCGRCARCLAGDDNLCPAYGIRGETRDGTAVERLVLPATDVAPVPEGLSAVEAAAFPLTFLTAFNMVVRKARVAAGDRVLVHAAASGVGVAAIQIARLHGAAVAATAGSEEKLALARQLGAELALDYRDAGWVQTVRAWAAPRGLDAVLDSVGEATFAPSLRLLRKGGRYVTCGATAGPRLEADFRLVFYRNLEILGSTMGRRADLLTLAHLIGSGALRVIVDRTFPLAEVAEAHRHLEERRALGKVVLTL